jgi:hypothetical protein
MARYTKPFDSLRRHYRHLVHNRDVIAALRDLSRTAPVATGQPVVLFNASTRLEGMSLNAAYSLLTGMALRLEGVPVHTFVCQRGMAPCVLGTNRNDPIAPPPCDRCLAQSRVLTSQTPVTWFNYQPDSDLDQIVSDLDITTLENLVWHTLPLGALVLPALRWVLRRHHLADDEPTRFLFRRYILSAASLAQQFGSMLDQVNPRAVVVFNGQFYPEATARYVTQQRGLPVISHEVGLQPFSAFFTSGEATAYPIDIPDTFQLSPAQNARLDAYLEQRFQGNFSMAGIRFWKGMARLDASFLERASHYRQIVPIFTNVIFDTSQGHANVVFDHMFDWLDTVLELIKAHPDTLFVLRAHPDEHRHGKESRESVADWAAAHGVRQLPNVLFVDSHEVISSYELIQKAKFVMVYNSTIGLEAAIMGAPVLCGGRARFTQLPTVFFPPSRGEFIKTAISFLEEKTVPVPSEYQINARRFLYTQLFLTSLPFGEFLEEDGVWNGYVKLKKFTLQQLHKSSTMQTILYGIVKGESFQLQEPE